jgi:hypothetical protein
MKLVGITWVEDMRFAQNTAGYELHHLRNGQPSFDVRESIVFEMEKEAGDALDGGLFFWRDLGARVAAIRSVIFEAQLGAFDPDHLITISAAGAVKADPNPPKKLDNFVMIIRAESNPPPPAVSQTFTLLQRFHLHDGFKAATIQLTPAGLTVGVGGEAVRFSVVAEFDDDVAADLSRHPIEWELLHKPGGVLTPVPPVGDICTLDGLTLNRKTGQLKATAAFRADAFVRCRLSSFESGGAVIRTGEQQVFQGARWNLPVEAEWIAGAGPQKRSQVRNLLLLPDGFRAADKNTFFELARRLAENLSNGPTAEPFRGLLNGGLMNVFAAFVPSREVGCSLSFELVFDDALQVGRDGTPEGSSDPGAGAITTLEQLTYVVGQPTKDDIPPPGTPPAQALQNARAKWNNLYGAYFAQYAANPEIATLFPKWLALTRRGIALERDTVFGVHLGIRPNIRETKSYHLKLYDLNEQRAPREDLEKLLGALFVRQGKAKQPVGNIWTTGRDKGLVAILCPGLPARGTSSPKSAAERFTRTACFTLEKLDGPMKIAGVAGATSLVTLAPDPLTSDPARAFQGLFLHEIAHSFDCGDEYGGSSGPVDLRKANHEGNVVVEGILRANPADPFDFGHTLWGRLPRIREAAVLKESPEHLIGTNQYKIKLKPGQGALFDDVKAGDPLYLQGRPLMRFINHLAGGGFPPPTPDFRSALSPRFTRVNEDPGDTILVELAPGVVLPPNWNLPPLTPDLFEPALIAPRLTPAKAEMLLLSPTISAHINAAGNRVPLNRRPGTACASQVADLPDIVLSFAKQVPVNLPNDPRVQNIAHQSKIVGLWDAGLGFDCGVFHAAGYCTMREPTEFEVNDRVSPWHAVRTGALTEYCQVCRYLIVDFFDPSLHRRIDNGYKNIYPETVAVP